MARRTFLGLAFGFLGFFTVEGQRIRKRKAFYEKLDVIDAGSASPEWIDIINGGGAAEVFTDLYSA